MNIFWLKLGVERFLIFAQEGGAAPGGGGAPGGGAVPPVNPLVQMAPMLMMFVVMFYFIVMRPQQKEQRRRQELLESLKKNDKVVTVGGIIGTIADISSDGSRVTLKVDDSTRMKFTRSSIQGPYTEKSEAESDGTK